MMTHEQLRALCCVVQSGSFRGAARRLHKTQSTVSHAIKSLEQSAGLTLLDRSHYRPVLTEAGKAFYRQAQSVLSAHEHLEALGQRLREGAPPSLSLSLSTLCAAPEHLKLLNDFSQAHPEAQLQLSTEHLSGVLESLNTGHAELAIGPHRGMTDAYESQLIDQVEMVCVASEQLIPLHIPQPISRQWLRPLAHILIADSGSEAPLEHLNVLPGGRQWWVNNYAFKHALLLAGLGWARIPKHMVAEDLRRGRLRELSVEAFNTHDFVPIYLIKLRHRPLSLLGRSLWQSLRARDPQRGDGASSLS